MTMAEQMFLYKLGTNGDMSMAVDENLIDIKVKTFEYAGFHRINLNGAYHFNKGDRYAIVVTEQSSDEEGRKYLIHAGVGFSKDYVNNWNEQIPEDGQKKNNYAVAVVNTDESYMNLGNGWVDWATVREGYATGDFEGLVIDNFSIKAYGIPTDPKDDSAVNLEKEEPVLTPSDNKAMDVRPETVGDYHITYAHQIPFSGKGKLTAESFGENFIVSQGNAAYKVKKIKASNKKHRIQILKLENAPKDVEKAVKKATKGDNGIPYTQNPYYVKDTDKVTPKFKKSGAASSVKVNINGKDYKAKKTEYDYDSTLKVITFKGENLAGSWTVK